MYDVERHVVILGLLLRSEMGLFTFVSNCSQYDVFV